MASDINKDPECDGSIYHVVVVGFHHKKGCIIEYAYPPLIAGETRDSTLLPEEWKYLPFLALPDGAHNFTEDTIYFHLPPKMGSSASTVYGVSYYRQIATDLLKKKDKDVTRGTVQKSVVVLSKIPMYGLLNAKLQLITHAYFEEKDFSQNGILKELYDHINASVSRRDESQIFLGLSARNLVQRFKHKIVTLFKLMLLERRVIFHTTPVHELVGSIMALLSLFPRMIEAGLSECTEAPTVAALQVPSMNQPTNKNQRQTGAPERIRFVKNTSLHQSGDALVMPDRSTQKAESETSEGSYVWQTTTSKAENVASSITAKLSSLTSSVLSGVSEAYKSQESDLDNNFGLDISDEDAIEFSNARLEMTLDTSENNFQDSSPYSSSIHSEIAANSKTTEREFDCTTTLSVDELGFPLSIFTKGHWCLPYVSLQQHDMLTNNIEQGFVAGATNVLFKTQQRLSDVIIDIDNVELIFHDNDLRRLLHLSAADLRFADHLVENVVARGNNDVFLDATGWEGGDEWIRSLFAEYLSGLLALSVKVCPDPKDTQDYNGFFLAAWKQTKNYRTWRQGSHEVTVNTEFAHPFHAQYSVSDVKLRFHHNLQSSERGRKFEGAITNANQAISNTGKFVGNAIISAKSSLSAWFSSKLPNT